MKRAIPILILCLIAVPVFSQMAPRDTAMTSVHGKAVVIEYGRPSLKGRSVSDFTSQLEGDRIWRAGSEQITTLKTEADLKIGEQKVPAGEYSVYLHCPEDGTLFSGTEQGTGTAPGRDLGGGSGESGQ